MSKQILIIGAGFTGATIGRCLADAGHKVTIYDGRDHVAGNCYDQRDSKTNIMVHTYGPHIFHTDDQHVWDFVNKFGEFMPYTLRVKAKVKDQIYSLPINLHTINQYFGRCFTPKEAEDYIQSLTDKNISTINSFEDVGLTSVGDALYKSFFWGYAQKQWGLSPKDIPAGVLKRLPLRFNYDDNYFNHKYQGIPKHGYTSIVDEMLRHKNIEVKLNKTVNRKDLELLLNSSYAHVIFTGAVDNLYDFVFGDLPYRTIRFEKFYTENDLLGCAVMSHPDKEIPFTRITEHKYFTPWEKDIQNGSVLYKEFSQKGCRGDIPYYPVRNANGDPIWDKYLKLCQKEKNITFAGRLAIFKYMDMDVCIKEALKVAEKLSEKLATDE